MLVASVAPIAGVNTIPASRFFKAVIALLNRLNCETIPSFNSGMEVGYWISIVFPDHMLFEGW